MNLGNGRLELQIKPNKVRFDDNQWHKVTVHRKVQEVGIIFLFISFFFFSPPLLLLLVFFSFFFFTKVNIVNVFNYEYPTMYSFIWMKV